MKTIKNLALFGAIALTSMLSLSACSSSEDVIDNPDYNPEDNTVKTEFTISLPKNVAGKTRMLEADVQGQATPVFRGMHKIVLIPFTTKATSESAAPATTIALDNIETPLGNNNSKVYSNVTFSVGTGAFLFYGEGTPTYATANEPTVAEKFKYGLVNRTGFTGAPSTYGFSLEPIYTSTTAHTSATKLCDYVSAIAATSTSLTNHTLASYLEDFKKLKSGSSASVLAAVVDLRTKVAAEADGTDRTTILAAIDDTKYDGTNKYLVPPAGEVTTYSLAAYNNYPAEINLPDGAVSISWSGNTASPQVNASLSGNTASLNSYVFPPSLCYTANSLVKVATTKASESYSTKNSWSAITTDLYTDGTVQGSTRSVALVDQVQYAVGRLELTIKAADGTLKDRNNADITVDATSGFPVSAVLIGSQKNVDFAFAPTGTNIYTIYDSKMPTGMSAKISSTETSPVVNHTLVFETAAATETVQVAVELTNNTGSDFLGIDGIIPKGGKFYLIGELNLTNGVKPKDSENHDINVGQIFKQDYVTKVNLTISKNEKDATTNSDQKKGLGGAYNVLPDLQNPSLELGLSVDLSWTPGLTFNTDI